jgi:uncharacterized membrane protein
MGVCAIIIVVVIVVGIVGLVVWDRTWTRFATVKGTPRQSDNERTVYHFDGGGRRTWSEQGSGQG